MIIIMDSTATKIQISNVVSHIEKAGLSPHLSIGAERTIIGVIGD